MKFGLAVALASVSFASAASFYWSGADGIEKVETCFDDGTTGTDGNPTNGYWYVYDDSQETPAGTSQFTWPSDVSENEYGSFFGPMVQLYSSITGTANLNPGYTYPYVGVAFNIGGNDTTKGFDVTSWGGICLSYSSTSKFLIELGVANEATVTKYNNHTYTLAAGVDRTANATWSRFTQESGWGTTVPVTTVTTSLNALKFKFSKSVSGTSNSFEIYAVGSEGQCYATCCLTKPITTSWNDCSTQSYRPKLKTKPAKATLVGRSLTFSGVTAAANVEVISLQGKVLMAGKVGSNPLNLSMLNAGVYMVRVNGENVHFSQRVVLP